MINYNLRLPMYTSRFNRGTTFCHIPKCKRKILSMFVTKFYGYPICSKCENKMVGKSIARMNAIETQAQIDSFERHIADD